MLCLLYFLPTPSAKWFSIDPSYFRVHITRKVLQLHLLFFLFLPHASVFGWTLKSLLRMDACDKYRTNLIRRTGKWLFKKCSLHLKFRLWEHGMQCAVREIIMAEVTGHIKSRIYYEYGIPLCRITVFAGMFIFSGLLGFILAYRYW